MSELDNSATLAGSLREEYRKLFGEHWPPWVGGVLLGLINVFLFTYAQPWTSLDGVLNWGDWFFRLVGLFEGRAPLSPLLRTGSIVNLGLLFGAIAAALLAREFAVRMSPVRELVKGFIGGILMGVGATLARGCNIGGFFSAISALSLSGFAMMLGLGIGAYLGLRCLLWEVERGVAQSDGSVPATGNEGESTWRAIQPFLGIIFILLTLAGAFIYDGVGYPQRGGILLLGMTLGIVNQRSRLCFVQAFREPFMTGDSVMTKGVIVALVVSVIGFAIFKWTVVERAEEFVRPTFWQGSLIGGLVFGIGMVLAGGCGAGTIWRAGEGHVKLWIALFGYILSASLFRAFLQSSGLIPKLGKAIFLPEVLGWEFTLIVVFGVLLLWYLAVIWNEATGKFSAM